MQVHHEAFSFLLDAYIMLLTEDGVIIDGEVVLSLTLQAL
jgi:hypothetical protein